MFNIGDRVRVERIIDLCGWSSENPERLIGECGTVRWVSRSARLPYTVDMDNGECNVRFMDGELVSAVEVPHDAQAE